MSDNTQSSKRRIAQGAAVNILGEVLSAAGEPLLFLVISRVLGAGMLGMYVLAAYYVSLFKRFAVMGLDKGMLRHVPLTAQSHNGRENAFAPLGTALRLTAIGGIALAAIVTIAPGTFLTLGGDADALAAAVWLQVMILAVPAQAATRVILFALRGASRMWPFVAVETLVAPLSLLVLSFVPLLFHLDPMLLGYAYTASAVIAFAASLRFLGRHTTGRLRLIFAPWDKALVAFSLPQGLTETLNFLLARIDVLMIAFFFPKQPELVAFYGIAALIAGLVKKVRLAFDTSLAPAMSDLFSRGDMTTLNARYREVGRWVLSLYLLVLGPVIFGAPALLLAFGDSFNDYWYVVPILAAGRLMNAAAGPAQTALLMSGRSKLELLNNGLINIVNVALNAVLIPKYHVVGAAVATSISLTLFSGIRVVQTARLVNLSAAPRTVFRLLGCAVPAGIPGMLTIASGALTPTVGILLGAGYLIAFPVMVYRFGDRSDIVQAVAFLKRRFIKQKVAT